MELLLLLFMGIILSIVIAAIVAKVQVTLKNPKVPHQKTDYSEIDYKMLYLTKYKKLPQIYYNVTLCFVIAIGVLDILISTEFLYSAYDGLLSFLVGTEDYISGILAMGIWVAVAFGAAYFVRYLSAIALSQKIVVADTLLDLKGVHTSSSAYDSRLHR